MKNFWLRSKDSTRLYVVALGFLALSILSAPLLFLSTIFLSWVIVFALGALAYATGGFTLSRWEKE